MAVTILDPVTALIVIDLQKGIAAIPSVHPIGDVVANAAALAAGFRRRNLPVVLVNVGGMAPGRNEQSMAGFQFPDGWMDLLPELDVQPGDHLVTKRTWGAFTGTGLERWLKDRGVTQVVVVGVATSAGVESTARQAHELGFHVMLATDAMTDRSIEAQDNSVTRIFPRLGETGTTAAILDLLPAN
ncbi:isochorismatase family protein [Sphingomonas sp. MMS24-J13]|uniref:isochorismatase family protein n=1 Tax=Sphingomonas sp. MMS24-J13 TaxID=3238686 RepID=UPI00384E72DA